MMLAVFRHVAGARGRAAVVLKRVALVAARRMRGIRCRRYARRTRARSLHQPDHRLFMRLRSRCTSRAGMRPAHGPRPAMGVAQGWGSVPAPAADAARQLAPFALREHARRHSCRRISRSDRPLACRTAKVMPMRRNGSSASACFISGGVPWQGIVAASRKPWRGVAPHRRHRPSRYINKSSLAPLS